MATSIPILAIRKRLGRDVWGVPRPFGPDGWVIDTIRDGVDARIIVTLGPTTDEADGEWLHASISHPDRMPSYQALQLLHQAVWTGTDGWAYQVFAPGEAHVNIHEFALHLWGRLDGRRELPNFGAAGSI